MKNTALSLMLVMLLCSCAGSEKSISDPNIQLNDNPQSSYLLDFKLVKHPGPFNDLEATAHYRVENSECVKPLALSGAVLPPEHHIVLKLNKSGDDRYTATFHQDALLDADYFNLGICRWHLQNVTVKFKSAATQFLASISNSREELQSNTPKKEHYLNVDYFKKPGVGDMVFGEKSGFYLPKMGSQFQAILSAKKTGSVHTQ